jgi:hypothetical protein
MSPPDWKDVLPVPACDARLQEAWFTTYDEPDAGLLVEHLLPSLLGTSHSLTQESQERTMFFGELSTTLEDLRGRITIISSPSIVERQSSQYPWLWRYISHFTVGSKSRAVQHAKLWAFHWKVGNEDHLELRVSSANLTTSAFKNQVQAGWQVSMRLDKRISPTTRRTWGVLVPFLEALGASAGDIAMARIERLVELLSRVECPADVTFVASIPGAQSAARQIKPFEVSAIHVLAPTIGEWNEKSLTDWCTDVGVDVSKTRLKWIAVEHPWAASNCWTLSTTASLALTSKGVKLDCLPNDVRLSTEHCDGDDRWSHAKLYLIRSKKMRRLLITSANWSPSAWGAGKQSPRNFELGIMIETDWTDLETMGKSFSPGTVPFCIENARNIPDDLDLQWAEASWDGKRIQLRARSSDAATPITAVVSFTNGSPKKNISVSLTDGAGDMLWMDSKRTPITAQFSQGSETLEVVIVDIRPPAEFAKTPLPEIDPSVSAALREAFLLQRYGGPMVDPNSIPGKRIKGKPLGVGIPGADYSVQAWIDARAAFGVVDKWRAVLAQATNDPMHLEKVRLDGEELLELYAKREEIAAVLVAEELGWRLI